MSAAHKVAAGAMVLTASLAGLVAYVRDKEGFGPSSVQAGVQVFHAYPDPAHGWALPTICNGSTRNVVRGQVATAAECERRLNEDLAVAERDAKRCMRRTDEDGPLWALTDLQFNAGIACQSAALRAYNAGNCQLAAFELFGAPQMRNGQPIRWDGTRVTATGKRIKSAAPLTDRTGRVLLRVGDPIPKWTTGAGIPLPGLFVRASDRANAMLKGCK